VKIKIEIKNRFTWKVLFEFETENNTIAKTVIEADLRSANLRNADLSNADLSGANLRNANLRNSDLSSADLSSADLSSADLDKRYISIIGAGSDKRLTTYCFEDNIVWCGCFTGTIEKFEAKVKETHENNPQYLKEYLGFINYLKSLM